MGFLVISKEKQHQIKTCIDSYLGKGMTHKMTIFNRVADEYGISVNYVRKISKELRIDMLEKLAILQSNLDFNEYHKRHT